VISYAAKFHEMTSGLSIGAKSSGAGEKFATKPLSVQVRETLTTPISLLLRRRHVYGARARSVAR
jgi:hypothetical protein